MEHKEVWADRSIIKCCAGNYNKINLKYVSQLVVLSVSSESTNNEQSTTLQPKGETNLKCHLDSLMSAATPYDMTEA